MSRRFGAIAVFIATIAIPHASPADPGDAYVRAYLDESRNVHVLTARGDDVLLTKRGRYQDPKVSPNGKAVGVQVLSRIKDARDEEIEVSQSLWIYSGGRIVRRISADGFIRAWGFWKEGEAVAIYSGALHFAGFYALYDLSTGEELERSKDPVEEGSPDWVLALQP